MAGSTHKRKDKIHVFALIYLFTKLPLGIGSCRSFNIKTDWRTYIFFLHIFSLIYDAILMDLCFIFHMKCGIMLIIFILSWKYIGQQIDILWLELSIVNILGKDWNPSHRIDVSLDYCCLCCWYYDFFICFVFKIQIKKHAVYPWVSHLNNLVFVVTFSFWFIPFLYFLYFSTVHLLGWLTCHLCIMTQNHICLHWSEEWKKGLL